MNIGLYKDGSYKVFKDERKLLNSLSKLKYVLVDNSTSLKGPMYTLVRAEKISLEKSIAEIIIGLTYCVEDCPWDDETTLHLNIPINSIDNNYSIYPLINQIFAINIFKEKYLTVDNCISVESIQFRNKNVIATIDEYSTEKELKRIFNHLNMMTNVMHEVERNHIVLKNKKWDIVKNIPSKFDYLLYNMEGLESFYKISKNEFDNLSSIKNINITATPDDEITDDEEICYFEDYNYVDANNFTDILEIFLFYPQLLGIENKIYKTEMSLIITLDTRLRRYKLSITGKEASNGICLYRIINKLLTV